MALLQRMTLVEVEAFLDEAFPQIHHGGRVYSLDAVGAGSCRMRLAVGERHLRPGGTVSGPTIMALADVALYAALLAAIGPVALAVTTDFTIHFLSKPDPGDLIADCRYLRIGKRLAVGEVRIRAAASPDPVAQVTATYSIPPPEPARAAQVGK